MVVYAKESLQLLRERVDLVDLLASHITLKRSGATFKACCPFHSENTPSFVVQRGDSHYHCFGCGAHGDAISFLMSHLKMSFQDAIEYLAEKFQVPLEKGDFAGSGLSRDHKLALFDTNEKAASFFHFYLLHSEEGLAALAYLEHRGIDEAFIKNFMIGYAPKERGLFRKLMHASGLSDELLHECALVRDDLGDFFGGRITFPIRDRMGRTIAFSARKIDEGTFGGKYINSKETPLFKKSKVLFGLYESRPRMIKDKSAILVEGQLDALRLISSGFNYAVAPLGTAFGESHIDELKTLGIAHVFLAMDADKAGFEAAIKIGNMLQAASIEPKVVLFPNGSDPDQFLREEGKEAMQKLLDKAVGFVPFLVDRLSLEEDTHTPAGKNALVKRIMEMIDGWKEPVVIYESRKLLAQILQVPQSVIDVDLSRPLSYTVRKGKIDFAEVNPDAVLEGDLVRWLLLLGSNEKIFNLIKNNVKEELFYESSAKALFSLYMGLVTEGKSADLLSISALIEEESVQLFLAELLKKKVNVEKAEELTKQTIQRLLERAWMQEREELKVKIQSGTLSDEEALLLLKKFDELKGRAPKINLF